MQCAVFALGTCSAPNHVMCEETESCESGMHVMIQAVVQAEVDGCLADAFCKAFQMWAKRPAFASLCFDSGGAWCVGPWQTYEQLFEQASAVAAVLRESGSAVVALSFPGNSQLLYTLEAACVLAHVDSCCIPCDISVTEWQQCALEAGVTLAIVDGRFVSVAASALRGRVVDASVWSLDALRAIGPLEAAQVPSPHSPCLIKYTSGSTGRPKGMRYWRSTEFLLMRLQTFPKVILSCYPPCWSTDTYMVWSAFLQGARVVFGNPLRMDVLDMHAIARPSMVVLTPFLVSGLQRVYAAAAAAASTPRARLAGALAVYAQLGGRCTSVCVGGAAVGGGLVQFLRDVLPCRVSESYGTSETHGIAIDGQPEAQVEVKLVPLDGVHDPDADTDVGEVCVRCRGMVKPEDWVGPRPLHRYLPDGFLRTGDVGRLCSRTGTLQVLGRLASARKLPTGVFFCPETLENLLVPAVPGIKAAVVQVDATGVLSVDVTPADDCAINLEECLVAVAQIARRAGLPVPTRISAKDLPELVCTGGTWKPKKPRQLSVRDTVCAVLGRDDWPMDQSMRNIGMDSLQGMHLASLLGPTVTYTTVMSSTCLELDGIAAAAAAGVDASASAGVDASASAGVDASASASAGVDASASASAAIATWRKPSPVASAGKVVFVTGGTGFLGQGIVAALLARADVKQVWCLVRATSMIPESWKQEAQRAPPRLVWVVGDVRVPGLGMPPETLAASAALSVPSELYGVIHAAADVKAYGMEGVGLLKDTNVNGTAHVLAFAAEHAVVHMVHVSTQSAEHPLANAYASTKAAAEQIVLPWAGLGLPVLVVRVPLVLGDNPDDWVHRMADAAREVGARPACDFLFAKPVWAVELAECAHRLAELVCHGCELQLQFVPLESSAVHVADLLRRCWPTIEDDLPPVNDCAWTHAAQGGTRFAPLGYLSL
jgi:nucleoside-diphosphate-sugar epimerase/acyl-CoA synthetase (AMP-forming)/AMP-acid ligase II